MKDGAKRFYVITGGPGSGKSSLLAALASRGFSTTAEAGRGIIQDQMAIDGRALPWSDPLLFAELMLSWDMRSYRVAEQWDGPVFFDRGIPDVLGYLKLMNIALGPHMQKAATTFAYNRTVFIAPPWKEIFRQDRERKQDFEEAVRTYDALAAVYTALRYQLVQLPQVSIEERTWFILDRIDLPDR